LENTVSNPRIKITSILAIALSIFLAVGILLLFFFPRALSTETPSTAPVIVLDGGAYDVTFTDNGLVADGTRGYQQIDYHGTRAMAAIDSNTVFALNGESVSAETFLGMVREVSSKDSSAAVFHVVIQGMVQQEAEKMLSGIGNLPQINYYLESAIYGSTKPTAMSKNTVPISYMGISTDVGPDELVGYELINYRGGKGNAVVVFDANTVYTARGLRMKNVSFHNFVYNGMNNNTTKTFGAALRPLTVKEAERMLVAADGSSLNLDADAVKLKLFYLESATLPDGK
jgi:hypothetical protein